GGVTALVLSRDQVDGDLGVGVAGELDARGFQLRPQRGEVLDDPVVDDRDLSGGVAMRVRVAVGRAAVGGPPGVAKPSAAGKNRRISVLELGLQVGQPPGTPADRQTTAVIDQGETGRVVTPVLHPAQRINHDGPGLTPPDVANDSTHDAYGTARRIRYQQI